mgnify:CR=1 FL=1
MYIVAEIGINHNGSTETALRMIDAAAAAGANCAKFQYYDVAAMYVPGVLKSRYAALRGVLERCMLNTDQMYRIKVECDACAIDFAATPETTDQAAELYDMGAAYIKVGSRQAKNLTYLLELSELSAPIHISQGLSTDKERHIIDEIFEIDDIDAETASYPEKIKFYACVSKYPAAISDYSDMEIYGYDGLSDHTPGIALPILAQDRGVEIVEKHFTLDRGQEGPDHHFSLEPQQFAAMVGALRELE